MATVRMSLRHFKGTIVRFSSFRRTPINPFVKMLPLSNIYRWNTSRSSFKNDPSQRSEIDQGSSVISSNPRQLFIGNLRGRSDCVDEETLRGYFSQYGEIEELKVMHHVSSGIPKGFAFLTFKDLEVAEKVLTVSHLIGLKEIDVKPSHPRNDLGVTLKQKREMTVLVSNVLHDTHKDQIKEHFSQFGNVEDVMVAKKGDYENDPQSYYVVFSTLDGAKRSLEKPTQKVAGQSVDSEVKGFTTSEAMFSKTKIVEVTSASKSSKLTVEAVREYFETFGEIEVINLVIKPYINITMNENLTIAFVGFTDHMAVDNILLNAIHTVNGLTVKVRRVRDSSLGKRNQRRRRSLQISVEGLPQSTQRDDVMRFFERTLGIMPSQVHFQGKNILSSSGTKWCIVTFSSENEIEHALKEPNQTFDGFQVCFRRLGWVK